MAYVLWHQRYLNEGIILRGEKSAPFVWYRGTKTQRLLQKIWELIALGLCLPALYLLFLERYTSAGKNALVMAIVGLLAILYRHYDLQRFSFLEKHTAYQKTVYLGKDRVDKRLTFYFIICVSRICSEIGNLATDFLH